MGKALIINHVFWMLANTSLVTYHTVTNTWNGVTPVNLVLAIILAVQLPFVWGFYRSLD